MGIRHRRNDFLIIGWQEDDLPIFGQVKVIFVLKKSALFRVAKYTTLGLCRHYHSFYIRASTSEEIFGLSELSDYQVYQGHYIKLCDYYITLRALVVKKLINCLYIIFNH